MKVIKTDTGHRATSEHFPGVTGNGTTPEAAVEALCYGIESTIEDGVFIVIRGDNVTESEPDENGVRWKWDGTHTA